MSDKLMWHITKDQMYSIPWPWSLCIVNIRLLVSALLPDRPILYMHFRYSEDKSSLPLYIHVSVAARRTPFHLAFSFSRDDGLSLSLSLSRAREKSVLFPPFPFPFPSSVRIFEKAPPPQYPFCLLLTLTYASFSFLLTTSLHISNFSRSALPSCPFHQIHTQQRSLDNSGEKSTDVKLQSSLPLFSPEKLPWLHDCAEEVLIATILLIDSPSNRSVLPPPMDGMELGRGGDRSVILPFFKIK